MKKMLFGLLIVLLAFPLMANGQNDGTGNKKAALNMMYWDNVQKPVIDEALAGFQAENPGITVNTTVVPWGQYWEKLQTTAVAGTAPDVFWMNVPNFPKYSSNKLLLNLQPYLDADGIDTSVYPSALIEKYSANGDIHVIPEQFDTIALAYNKAMFDEAGLAYPDSSWDWNDLRDAAIALTKDTQDGKQYGFVSTHESQNGYYNFMVMNDGDIISKDWKKSGFDKQESIEAIQFLVDMMYKDKCAPEGLQIAELNNPADMFNSGKAAMITIGSWYVPVVYQALGENVDVAPLPKSPRTNERKTIIHGLGWAGYSNTKEKDATWALLKTLTAKEFNISLASSGITIPSYEGMADDWVQAIPSMNLQIFIDAQAYSHPYPVSHKTSEWMAVEARELKDAWLGYKSPEEAMMTIADEMNKILASEP